MVVLVRPSIAKALDHLLKGSSLGAIYGLHLVGENTGLTWNTPETEALNDLSVEEMHAIKTQGYKAIPVNEEYCDACWFNEKATWLGPKILLSIGGRKYKGHKKCLKRIHDREMKHVVVSRHATRW